jgi:hypothetical protein
VIPGLFGYLTVISLGLMLFLGVVASLYVIRLRNRQSTQLSEELDSLNGRDPQTPQAATDVGRGVGVCAADRR